MSKTVAVIRQGNPVVIKPGENTGLAIAAANRAEDAEAGAVAAAGVALAAAGPFYTTTAAGIAATESGDEFNVESSPTAPTFDVYRNDSGTAVLVRDGIIRDPSAPGTAGFIGTTAGDLQSVLDDFEARIAALEP